MARPVLRAEDPPQIRMADETYAHQIEHLPLVPVAVAPRSPPYARHLWQLSFFLFPPRQDHFQHKSMPVNQAAQVVEHFQVRLEVDLLFGVGLQIIDAADAVQEIEPQIAVVAKKSARFEQGLDRDFDPRVDRLEVVAANARPQPLR